MKMNAKLMSGLMTVAMVGSMATPVFATELTPADIAGAATDGSGNYHVYELENADEIVAGKASSVVVLDAEATNFKVTVPIALHVRQDAEGNKTYADDMAEGTTGAAKIINECALGQVKINDVKIVEVEGYTISAWNADYANMKVNSKTFGFKLNGLIANTDGTLADFAVAEDTIASKLVNAEDGKSDIDRVYADYEFTRSGDSAFPVINNGCVLPITYEAKLPAYSQAVVNTNIGGVVFTVDFN